MSELKLISNLQNLKKIESGQLFNLKAIKVIHGSCDTRIDRDWVVFVTSGIQN